MANIINFGTTAQDDTPIVTDLLQVTKYTGSNSTGSSSNTASSGGLISLSCSIPSNISLNCAFAMKVYNMTLRISGSVSSGNKVTVNESTDWTLFDMRIAQNFSMNETINVVGRSLYVNAGSYWTGMSSGSKQNQRYFVMGGGANMNPPFEGSWSSGINSSIVQIIVTSGITVNYTIRMDVYVFNYTQ